MSDERFTERECYCDSRQCDICTPLPPDAPPRGDLFAAAQTLAADNARLCSIVIAADKLAMVIRHYAVFKDRGAYNAMIAAADAFDVVRQGH